MVLLVYIPYHTIIAHRCSYEFWLAEISFSLQQKSVASEVIIRSAKINGRQFSSPLASNSFPDSVDIHHEMNG